MNQNNQRGEGKRIQETELKDNQKQSNNWFEGKLRAFENPFGGI